MKNEEEFFRQIEQAARNHEEEYIPGAWEDFCKERKKDRLFVLFWRFGAAAAIFLLFIGIALLFIKPSSVQNNSIKLSKARLHQAPKAVDDSAQKAVKLTAVNRMQSGKLAIHQYKPAENAKGITQQRAPGDDSIAILASRNSKSTSIGPEINHPPVVASDTAFSKPAVKDRLIANSSKPTEKKPRTIYELLNDTSLNAKTLKDAQKKQGSFTYSLVLSPSLGNQKLNLGTGMEIAYKIGDHFYVSSGLAYASLHAQVNNDNSAVVGKQLQGINLNVSGFELPFSVQYRTQGGFYATAGVLAMTVVNDHLEYNYLTQTTQTITQVDGGGTPHQVITVISTPTKETSPEKINNYLGFYTFSVGKKTSLGKKQFNIGPFLKVPFGPVSSQNIKLVQGGVQLSFGF